MSREEFLPATETCQVVGAGGEGFDSPFFEPRLRYVRPPAVGLQ